jgi:hypothetical protein
MTLRGLASTDLASLFTELLSRSHLRCLPLQCSPNFVCRAFSEARWLLRYREGGGGHPEGSRSLPPPLGVLSLGGGYRGAHAYRGPPGRTSRSDPGPPAYPAPTPPCAAPPPFPLVALSPPVELSPPSPPDRSPNAFILRHQGRRGPRLRLTVVGGCPPY